MSITGEQAWQMYKDIRRVVETRYQLPEKRVENSSISMAIQRLGEAVIFCYKLDPKDHLVSKNWRLILQHDPLLKLSSVKEMLTAHVIEWEPEIESLQAGHDVWTDGRTAAFRPQQSLQETLNEDYKKIKKIVDTTFEDVWGLLSRIEAVVQIELNRLDSDEESGEKITEIKIASKTLREAVAYKYKKRIQGVDTLSQRCQAFVDSTDLYSFNTLLDAKIKKWSLRQALNLSTHSLASKMFGLQEALWDKTTALENVETALFKV